MSRCCDSESAEKRSEQSLSQESRGGSWLDKIKAAFGFSAKLVPDSKNDAVRQQNHQKSCCD